jgi:hypothetical protein
MSEKKFNLSQTGAQVQEILNSAKSTDQVLTEIQEAMETLPDGQAVSAQVALNTAAIQELDTNKASKTEVVFDISAYHATGGVLAEYADLTAALGTNGANIPDDLRKGGMSIKFVQSSDNKYVQYRLMANSFTTDINAWQNYDEFYYLLGKTSVANGIIELYREDFNPNRATKFQPSNNYQRTSYIDVSSGQFNLSDNSNVRYYVYFDKYIKYQDYTESINIDATKLAAASYVVVVSKYQADLSNVIFDNGSILNIARQIKDIKENIELSVYAGGIREGGVVDTDTNYVHTDYIDVSKNVLNIGNCNIRAIEYYNSNKESIFFDSTMPVSPKQSYVTTAAYVRIGIYSNSIGVTSFVDNGQFSVASLRNDVNKSNSSSEWKNGVVSIYKGGLNTTTHEFNSDANYEHTGLIDVSSNIFSVSDKSKVRFYVYFDSQKKYLSHNESTDPDNTMLQNAAFISVVSRYQQKISDLAFFNGSASIQNIAKQINSIRDFKIYPNGLDDSGNVNSDSSAYHTDYIDLRNNILSFNGYKVRKLIYFDANKVFQKKVDNPSYPSQTDVNSYVYARMQIFADSVTGNSFIYNGERNFDALNKRIVENSNLIPSYRYIGFTFPNYGAGGMHLIGSNDLKRFKMIGNGWIFKPSVNIGIRDPSVIKIDDWFYIVYTPISVAEGYNYIGVCRSKDLMQWEELPNLVLAGANGEDFSNGYCWAPSWFKDGDNYYILCGCSEDGEHGNHYIFDYDVENHSVSTGFKLNNVYGIDGHLYKVNGYYYILQSGGVMSKSLTLKNATYTPVTNTGLEFAHYEGQYLMFLDNGKFRVFGQNVLNVGDNVNGAHIYYQDSSNIEGPYGERIQIKYNEETEEYIHGINYSTVKEFYHFTIYDRNCWYLNNNNFGNIE